MSEGATNTGRIVRWEVLPGLPGDGPVPFHFHLGHPTPWAEGFVVRFWNEDRTTWIGNFQAGITNFGRVIELAEALLLVVVSRGACYVFAQYDPDTVLMEGDEVTDTLVTNSGTLILAHLTGEISALGRTGTPLWSRRDLGAEGLALRSCVSGVIVADIEDWEGNWHTVRLAEVDGTDSL